MGKDTLRWRKQIKGPEAKEKGCPVFVQREKEMSTERKRDTEWRWREKSLQGKKQNQVNKIR